jgi:hypothetical protein
LPNTALFGASYKNVRHQNKKPLFLLGDALSTICTNDSQAGISSADQNPHDCEYLELQEAEGVYVETFTALLMHQHLAKTIINSLSRIKQTKDITTMGHSFREKQTVYNINRQAQVGSVGIQLTFGEKGTIINLSNTTDQLLVNFELAGIIQMLPHELSLMKPIDHVSKDVTEYTMHCINNSGDIYKTFTVIAPSSTNEREVGARAYLLFMQENLTTDDWNNFIANLSENGWTLEENPIESVELWLDGYDGGDPTGFQISPRSSDAIIELSN